MVGKPTGSEMHCGTRNSHWPHHSIFEHRAKVPCIGLMVSDITGAGYRNKETFHESHCARNPRGCSVGLRCLYCFLCRRGRPATAVQTRYVPQYTVPDPDKLESQTSTWITLVGRLVYL